MTLPVVQIAAGIDEIPTLEQVDAMLCELRVMAPSADVADTIDELLDLRSLLIAA